MDKALLIAHILLFIIQIIFTKDAIKSWKETAYMRFKFYSNDGNMYLNFGVRDLARLIKAGGYGRQSFQIREDGYLNVECKKWVE